MDSSRCLLFSHPTYREANARKDKKSKHTSCNHTVHHSTKKTNDSWLACVPFCKAQTWTLANPTIPEAGGLNQTSFWFGSHFVLHEETEQLGAFMLIWTHLSWQKLRNNDWMKYLSHPTGRLQIIEQNKPHFGSTWSKYLNFRCFQCFSMCFFFFVQICSKQHLVFICSSIPLQIAQLWWRNQIT